MSPRLSNTDIKYKILFLSRFLIISVLYYVYNCIRLENELTFLLRIEVFLPLLILYFFLVVVCFFLSENVTLIVKIISDSLFLILFIIQTIFLLYIGIEDFLNEGGDSGLVIVFIAMYIPIVIPFIVWLFLDIKKKYKKTK